MAVDSTDPIDGPAALTGNLILNDAAALTAFGDFANGNTVYVTGTTSITGLDLTGAVEGNLKKSDPLT
jgi:hypothetical protein